MRLMSFGVIYNHGFYVTFTKPPTLIVFDKAGIKLPIRPTNLDARFRGHDKKNTAVLQSFSSNHSRNE